VIGEAASLAELRALLELLDDKPALLVLDWDLPGLKGADRIADLRSGHSGLKIIAMSARSESRALALTAGVDAFISMVEPPEVLLRVIHDFLG
jgi:DNA-binding response OmpR family regulator